MDISMYLRSKQLLLDLERQQQPDVTENIAEINTVLTMHLTKSGLRHWRLMGSEPFHLPTMLLPNIRSPNPSCPTILLSSYQMLPLPRQF